MLQGAEVRQYFKDHADAKEIIENTEAQFKTWQPGLTHEEMYRKLTIEDITYITFEGWQGEKGVFAWYYPGGVPHYTRIGELEGVTA